MIKKYSWVLIVLVIMINTGVRFTPPDLLYPIGRFYLRLAGGFQPGYFRELFTDAGGRFLYQDYAYFLGDALCWLLVALFTYYNTKNYTRILCTVFAGFTASNLLDEILFEPTRLGVNEIVFGIGIVIIATVMFVQERINAKGRSQR